MNTFRWSGLFSLYKGHKVYYCKQFMMNRISIDTFSNGLVLPKFSIESRCGKI